MLQDGTLAKAKKYLDLHFPENQKLFPRPKSDPSPTVTISRETGTGADRVCESVISLLQQHQLEFTYFDKTLINKIIESQNIPERFAQYLEEDRSHPIQEMIQEMLGMHPPTGVLLRKANEAILSLAMLGNVILVGRGSTIIAGKLNNALHFRLIGPVELRVKNMMYYYDMQEKDARAFIKKEDAARRDYVKHHYGKDPDDSNLYHAIINLGQCSIDDAASIITAMVLEKRKLLINSR